MNEINVFPQTKSSMTIFVQKKKTIMMITVTTVQLKNVLPLKLLI